MGEVKLVSKFVGVIEEQKEHGQRTDETNYKLLLGYLWGLVTMCTLTCVLLQDKIFNEIYRTKEQIYEVGQFYT